MPSRTPAVASPPSWVEARKRKRSVPLSRVYQLLEPGPVVLLTTAGKARPNAMPLSWHTMMEFEPPLVGCVLSNRNHSFATLLATRECVINVPSAELAPEVVGCGNTSGRTVDKFRRFGLTPVAAEQVRAPLIDECYANLECKVIDTRMVAKYGFVILQVVQAWMDKRRSRPRSIHHLGQGRFMISGRTITLPSKKK